MGSKLLNPQPRNPEEADASQDPGSLDTLLLRPTSGQTLNPKS